MSFLRGALNLLQGDSGGADAGIHPLVGKELIIGQQKLRVTSVIAEGGFAVVLAAQDQSGRRFALKQQIANDKDALSALSNEIAVMEELRGHPNIVRYFNTSKTRATNGGTEFLVLMELCTGGSAVDLLKTNVLTPIQVLRTFYAACRAVKHMHCREKPITHRDIKVENLLFDGKGLMKLCDFGSSTRDIFHPDDSWSSIQRITLIEEMQRNTTPMYRAPEISDEYMNMPVGPQQDVWALGCVLFYLCYRVHPFEDSAKLRIINAKYVIPSDDTIFTMFIPLIQSCLQPNPMNRPTIADLVERTEALAAAMEINPDEGIPGIPLAAQRNPSPDVSYERSASRAPQVESSDVSQQASAMFGALKGQGMSIFKQIKDRSAAVVQTVQATYGNSRDIVWITSRMMLAPIPELVPESLAHQAEESLRNFCTSQSRPFLMVNFSYRGLRCEYPTTPLDVRLPPIVPGPPPTVNYLLKICRMMTQFLRQNPNGFVVFYGVLGHSVLISAALIIYNRLLSRPMNALELVTSRRSTTTLLPPSFHRVLDLFSKIVNTKPASIRNVIHNYPVYMMGLTMEPAPYFNVNRTGCRPFAEVFCGGNKLWSTLKDYEQLKSYEVTDRPAEIPFDKLPVGDDVTIVVYHARWNKMTSRLSQFFMFSIGLHANLCDNKQKQLVFNIGDVDIKESDRQNFPESFKVILKLQIDNHDRGFESNTPEFLGYQPESVASSYLVDGKPELDQIGSDFGEQPHPPSSRTDNANRPSQPESTSKPQATGDFFNSLDWNQGTTSSVQKTTQEIDLFAFEEQKKPVRPEPPVQKPQQMTAEDYERIAGIRVGKEEPDDDYSKYQFDCDRSNETPIMGKPSPVQSLSNPVNDDFDLIGLGSGVPSQQSKPSSQLPDPFADIFGSAPAPPSQPSVNLGDDLLGGFTNASVPSVPMHRNVSAPSFTQTIKPNTFDPFAEFLNSTTHSNPGSGPSSQGNSASTTPKPSRPNYNRTAFDAINPTAASKPKVTADAFGDLLSGHGFTPSLNSGGPKTMADMQRAEESKTMSPIQIKIRDWTKGKEKNIRTLLGSLTDVLWEGADNWHQPPMSELLQPAQVKKWYRKACLVVHPDKQVGKPHEELAKAVFTELNIAWDAFEQSGN